MNRSRHSDLIGQVLDERYRVLEPIGEGAMGNVYRGERLKLNRVVAIKVMNEEIANENSRQRFEREAMAMAKLAHPHCASVLDVGSHDGRPYVVMEFVSGQNLKKLLEQGALPIPRAVEITKQVLSGLSHAHEHGIIHRDIKPANVVLSQHSGLGDHVKILDFGLARFNQESSDLTGGMVLGTPNYMAPEQISGAPLDHRIDIYACGVLLFELLTGVKPFTAADPVAVCMQHLKEPPPRLADKRPGVAFGGLEDVVARALAKDRDQRFSSADELSRALVAASTRAESQPPAAEASGSNAVTRAAPRPQRSKRIYGVALAGTLVAGAAIAAVVIIARREDPQPAATAKPEVRVETPPPTTPAPPAAKPDAIGDLVKQAHDLDGAGQRQAAIDLLLRARKTYPSDARLPYEASKLYLDKMWWVDGLKLARAAIELDPAYRSDADLIKLVVRGFNSTRGVDYTLAHFLRQDIGAAAKPFLEDVAQHHANPIVRKRAEAELRNYQ